MLSLTPFVVFTLTQTLQSNFPKPFHPLFWYVMAPDKVIPFPPSYLCCALSTWLLLFATLLKSRVSYLSISHHLQMMSSFLWLNPYFHYQLSIRNSPCILPFLFINLISPKAMPLLIIDMEIIMSTFFFIQSHGYNLKTLMKAAWVQYWVNGMLTTVGP